MLRRLHTLLYIWALALVVSAQGQETIETRYSSHSLLSKGKWVKIRVKDEGVYQLSKAALSKMGFNDISKVKLYGYNLPMLPETDLEYLPDDLTEIPMFRKNDGTPLFYSCGTTKFTMKESQNVAFSHTNNPYSTHIYYFLTDATEGAPLSMNEDEGGNGGRELTSFPACSIIDNDEYSFLNAGRTFFENYDFANGNSKNYTIPMPGNTGGDATIKIQFGAAGSSSSSLNVKNGGNTITSLNFMKLKEYEYGDVRSAETVWRNVISENPTLTLQHTRTSGVSGHLDYINVGYERKTNIGNIGWLTIRTPEEYSYNAKIEGANDNTRVWSVDIESEKAYTLMKGNFSGNTYDTRLSLSAGRTFVAVNTNASFPSPEIVGAVANQDLHSLSDIDLLIIVPANNKLTEQALRLAKAHEEKDGLRCAVVRADEIYNEFSSGTPDITAYRRLLKMLYDKASDENDRPKNVLLFGNCMWDNRMVTSGMRTRKQEDYLLCYESVNSVSHTDSYVAEEYITLLADGKGVSPLKEKPDCGVGRLPVANSSEAKVVVDKLIRYMNHQESGAWMNTICMLADDGNANTHGNDAESVWASTSKLYPNFRYKKIYWDSYERKQTSTGNSYPDAYNEINKTMQDGALIMNYTGHGAAYCLSHEQVLKTQDFQHWSSPRLPLWLTAACDVVPFDMNIANIGIEAVLNKDGGAMGFIGTARTVYSTPNKTLNTNFMKRVLGKKSNGERFTLGEALAEAKKDILGNRKSFSKNDTINKTHFILLGDPAIVLPVAEMSVVIDKFNGKNVEKNNKSIISAGDVVEMEGHIVDVHGKEVTNFEGVISASVFDNIETITCKDNDGSAAEADREPLTYSDRKNTIFIGSDSIVGGRFKVQFPVSMDINYSNEEGEISLFAIASDKNTMASSKFNSFTVGGTSNDIETDTIAPTIALWMETKTFVEGGIVSDTPKLIVELSDESGINTTGSGIGHDIVAIVDGKESSTYILNSYYEQEVGDYRNGSIVFTLPKLESGKHILTLRAFDTFNNMCEQHYEFEVVEGLHQEIEWYDLTGRLLLKGEKGTSLPKGVYVKRVLMTSPQGIVKEDSIKILVE